jgi:acyl transferase domain-containing protein
MLTAGVMASFCRDATGFTPGDGAGAVVLMRADQASSLGLQARARMLSIGACTDSKSMIAPNVDGQISAMRRAYVQLEPGGLAPAGVQFVEAHGTGTLIGDEIETRSLADVYAGATRHLAVGALKSKFGHCFSAAGMASLIKAVLALEHEVLPANHFERPLKLELGWAALELDPLLEQRRWPRAPHRVRRAAINAFGTGGINYHLLLEEALAHELRTDDCAARPSAANCESGALAG